MLLCWNSCFIKALHHSYKTFQCFLFFPYPQIWFLSGFCQISPGPKPSKSPTQSLHMQKNYMGHLVFTNFQNVASVVMFWWLSINTKGIESLLNTKMFILWANEAWKYKGIKKNKDFKAAEEALYQLSWTFWSIPISHTIRNKLKTMFNSKQYGVMKLYSNLPNDIGL